MFWEKADLSLNFLASTHVGERVGVRAAAAADAAEAAALAASDLAPKDITSEVIVELLLLDAAATKK